MREDGNHFLIRGVFNCWCAKSQKSIVAPNRYVEPVCHLDDSKSFEVQPRSAECASSLKLAGGHASHFLLRMAMEQGLEGIKTTFGCLELSFRFTLSIILTGLLAGATVTAAEPIDPELDAALGGLQKKYSQVRDLRMEFIQSYKSPRRAAKTETGTLVLKRPGMMRWEYKTPIEKLFVSNGKTVFFYLPQEKQVQKSKVKESRDQRIPFLFLLGKEI